MRENLLNLKNYQSHKFLDASKFVARKVLTCFFDVSVLSNQL